MNILEYCQGIAVSFMVVHLSDELCSHLSNQVNGVTVALLKIWQITDRRAGKAFCSALTVSPVGSGELCSFPTTICISIMVFKMLIYPLVVLTLEPLLTSYQGLKSPCCWFCQIPPWLAVHTGSSGKEVVQYWLYLLGSFMVVMPSRWRFV